MILPEFCWSCSKKMKINYWPLWGSSRAFSGRGICHFLWRDKGKLGFKIAGNGIRYTHGTKNVLIFLLGKREKCEMIA